MLTVVNFYIIITLLVGLSMKKNIFEGMVENRYCEVRIENQNGKKQYYVLVNVSGNKDKIEKLRQTLEQENKTSKKEIKLVGIEKQGKVYPFVKLPVSMVDARYFAFKNRDNNKLHESQENEVSQKKSNYKPCTKFIATALIATTLFGASAIAINKAYNEDILVSAETQEVNDNNQINEIIKTDLSDVKQEKISSSQLTYDTFCNSAGNLLVELDDALKIADVCYDEIKDELKTYAQTNPNKYSFDVSKFDSTMFVGEWIKESSLILTKKDIDDACRGPFKIGSDAILEANKVSKDLCGKEIIESENDLYDPVKACKACIYIAIKNYEYCQGVTEEVSPEMVFDTYLFGCGNIRNELKRDDYQQKNYSKIILAYSQVLKEYQKEIENGNTDGSHDKFWSDCYNKLNKVPKQISSAEKQIGE